ncbi:hypothetical protein DRD23_08955 [Salmonella enterica subsp. enterica serovar Enteritidis]|nr:hypothetical protein [Salmonella enterica subsp. enterica serovar Enteritidis]
MSRTRHRSNRRPGIDSGVKDAQNRHSRMDERKLAGLTLDECLSYQTFNIDGEYYDGEILEEPPKILDLGNDKKYKRQANEGFQYS